MRRWVLLACINLRALCSNLYVRYELACLFTGLAESFQVEDFRLLERNYTYRFSNALSILIILGERFGLLFRILCVSGEYLGGDGEVWMGISRVSAFGRSVLALLEDLRVIIVYMHIVKIDSVSLCDRSKGLSRYCQ